jgi:hypothetical protein
VKIVDMEMHDIEFLRPLKDLFEHEQMSRQPVN